MFDDKRENTKNNSPRKRITQQNAWQISINQLDHQIRYLLGTQERSALIAIEKYISA